MRAVDDFSEFLINCSVTSTEKLALYGIDEVVNSARFFMGIGSITFDQSGLPVLKQPAAEKQGPWLQLQGRALDLKAAYNQCWQFGTRRSTMSSSTNLWLSHLDLFQL